MTLSCTRLNLLPVKLLAISFRYPPILYPRSIQVARLLVHLQVSSVVVCADEKSEYIDATIQPNGDCVPVDCLRVPFHSQSEIRIFSSIKARFSGALLNRIPDQYRSWKPAVLTAVEELINSGFKPDVIVSFAQPMSDHLIGLKLSRRYNLPWVAHFSDPWVDNPFNEYNPLTGAINAHQERTVIGAATKLIFTSKETLELVLEKYPKEWKDKSIVIPHAFDPRRYPQRQVRDDDKLTVRYLGDFYRHRTPKPLFDALQIIVRSDPSVLKDVRFELIGWNEDPTLSETKLEKLPEGLVSIKPSVNYQKSIALMVSADGLLIIDAPLDNSVFLPSKLVDYIGAGRPILGITPLGTAANLIMELGGLVADPRDAEATARVIRSFLSLLRKNRDACLPVWGNPSVRNLFEIERVAADFQDILQDLVKTKVESRTKLNARCKLPKRKMESLL